MLSLFAVLSGLAVDMIYSGFGVSASAIAGQAGEVVPYWLQFAGALVVILLSVKPLYLFFRNVFHKKKEVEKEKHEDGDSHTKGETECRAPS